MIWFLLRLIRYHLAAIVAPAFYCRTLSRMLAEVAYYQGFVLMISPLLFLVLIILPLQVFFAGWVLCRISSRIGLPELTLARAVFVTFRGMLLTYATMFLTQILLLFTIGLGGAPAGPQLVARPLSLAISLLAMTLLYRQILPTTYSRALLATFVQMAAVFALLAAMALMLFVYGWAKTGKLWV